MYTQPQVSLVIEEFHHDVARGIQSIQYKRSHTHENNSKDPAQGYRTYGDVRHRFGGQSEHNLTYLFIFLGKVMDQGTNAAHG